VENFRYKIIKLSELDPVWLYKAQKKQKKAALKKFPK
jgi:hypothetical protein